MKLRNKKTGEVKEFGGDRLELTEYYKENGGGIKNVCSYHSLAKLNEDWEDYKPSEPLIKDEKIRKAVRAWAESNCSHKLHQFNDYQLEDENNYLIEFTDNCFTNLKVGRNYTIAELCGEEEEC